MANVVNAVDSGMHPANSASQNQLALQTAVATASSSGGGTVAVPSITVVTAGPPPYPSTPYPIQGPVIIGGGSEATIEEVIVSGTTGYVTLNPTTTSDLFQVNNAPSMGHGDDDIGGVRFHDFQVAVTQTTATTPSAINALAGQDVSVERVVFTECPIGVSFSNTLEGTARNCIFVWNTQASGIGVYVTGPAGNDKKCNQILIEKCNFRTNADNSPYVAIEITQSEHTAIKSVRIAGTNYGIKIAPNATTTNDVLYTTIEDVESGTVSAGIAVMPPAPNGSECGGLVVVGGWYFQTTPTSYANGGLYFDTAASASIYLTSPYDEISFTSLPGGATFTWIGK